MAKYKVIVSMLVAFGLFMSAPSGRFVAQAAEKASTADELAELKELLAGIDLDSFDEE